MAPVNTFEVMKFFIFLCILFFSAAHSLAQTPVWAKEPANRPKINSAESRKEPPSENRGFVLPDGTPVKLKLMRELSSATEQPNATVDFEVLESVTIDEKVIIRPGAIALGTVTEAIPKRRMGKTGKLAVRLDSVMLIDGRRLPLDAVNNAPDGSRVANVTTTAALISMVFFPAAPLALLMKGKDISIPNGTFITAYIKGDHKLDPDKFTIAAEKISAAVQFKVEKPEMDNAEIWIEEKFVGNLPSTIKLPEGEYEVIVKKSGYRRWKRTIAVTAGSQMNVTISLEKMQ